MRDKRIEGIQDIWDESSREGMRIVIELTKTADPEEILQLSGWPDYQRLIVARLQVDERVSDRRDPDSPLPDAAGNERRAGRERREENAAMTITRAFYGQGGADTAGRRRAGVFVLTLVLAALVVAWLVPAFR